MPAVQHRRAVILLAFLAFISIGLPGGLLGVAWPAISAAFDIPLGALGSLLLTITIGYLASSAMSGYVLARLSAGGLMTVSAAALAGSLIGYALAPGWWVVIALGLFTGLGSGTIDAGLNTYIATHYSTRTLNWLHASFGVGAASGPLIMTALIEAERSWRTGYVIVGMAQLALALALGLTRQLWQETRDRIGEDEASVRTASGLATLRLPVVWVSVALFVVFVGIESAAGQWTFTLFTQSRGVSEDVAGLWVSIYWGSLTIGRIGFGVIAGLAPVRTLLRVAVLSIALGTGLIAANISNTLSFAGLALTGLAIAPLFPSWVADTPRRLRREHVANTVGFQVAGAVLGGAALPGTIGIMVDEVGLEAIGVALFATSLVLLALHEGLNLIAGRRTARVREAAL